MSGEAPAPNVVLGGEESGQPDNDSAEDAKRDCLEVDSDRYRGDS